MVDSVFPQIRSYFPSPSKIHGTSNDKMAGGEKRQALHSGTRACMHGVGHRPCGSGATLPDSGRAVSSPCLAHGGCSLSYSSVPAGR
jgi:hypothetical protein